jgi:uncharacterized protein YciI
MAARTFMLTYAYVPDMTERRQPYRADHLKHLEAARDRGMLTLAAAFADPVDGALLLVEAESSAEVFGWLANDPYQQDGLIRSATVREINVAVRATG